MLMRAFLEFTSFPLICFSFTSSLTFPAYWFNSYKQTFIFTSFFHIILASISSTVHLVNKNILNGKSFPSKCGIEARD
jgi:hypothetical protein